MDLFTLYEMAPCSSFNIDTDLNDHRLDDYYYDLVLTYFSKVINA